ncbi:hypothetical protein GLOTRDRAFT_136008, partial [Gloeophyllum trabeum ATCC 11539]
MDDADADADIDTDALQAQIDISSSLADDLVSSWIKPNLASPAAAAALTEADLQEYVRRPHRLGVGAPLPEANGVSGRDGMRLKGQLLGNGKGKKREREEGEAGGAKRQADDDDEEDSRAGAIRKKVKVDPFAAGKKKNKKQGAQGQSQSSPAVNQNPKALDAPSDRAKGSSAPTVSVAKNGEPSASAKNERASAVKNSPAGAPSGASYPQGTPPTISPNGKQKISTSETKLDSPSPTSERRSNGLPLLNLDGPPPGGEGSDHAKKKRRRKKKKNKAGGE